jgi:dCMP deaminase
MRKSWDEYFMSIAVMVAERSTCNKLHVGCVLVKDNRIISTGYNGSIRGHDHCADVGCLLNDEGRCIRTVHAEQNVVLLALASTEGATAYVTHEPCETCTKLLNQAGVKRVVFANAYKNTRNQEFIDGMTFEQLRENAS